MNLVIPLYTDPNTNPLVWEKVVNCLSSKSIIIVNPASGAGDTFDSSYEFYISRALSKGIGVYGYVDTNYTKRDLNKIKDDISRYKSWYNVSNIFFDQVSSDIKSLEFYKNIKLFMQSTGHTMLNPGMMPDKSYIDLNDNTVVFEGSFNTYMSTAFPVWLKDTKYFGITHLLYSVKEQDLDNALNLVKKNNVDYFYFTDRDLIENINTWFGLPPYFDKLLKYS